MENPTLFFVIPCYNEEEALPLSAPVFRKKVRDLQKEISPQSRIVLVNDGSQDATWQIIQNLYEEDKTFAGIRLKHNCGHQNALTAGLMWSRDKCDITISMDADLQDDIEAVDRMVAQYKTGSDIVCGVRDSRESDTFLKRTTARGYYGIMKAFGSDLIYDHADYRLMNRKALEALARYHGYDLFLRGLVNWLGCKVSTVSYDRRAREAGESKYTVKKMLKLAGKGFACARSRPETAMRPVLDPMVAEVLYG